VNRFQRGLKPGGLLRAGLLFALACAGLPQAAFSDAPDTDPAGAVSWRRLAQIHADEEALRKSDPRADAAKQNSGATRHRAKTAARAGSGALAAVPAAPDAAHVRELMQLSGAEIQGRVAEQRRILRYDPRNEAARQTLGLIAVELGNRVLDLEALGRKHELDGWIEFIRKSLHDTLWRTTQLARFDGRSAAALGLFHSEGILTARAPEKGCDQYVRAAQNGHAAAAYQAALCKSSSEPALARRLLERAADKGHPGAQELMGRACIEGKDTACAAKWLERAAAKGRPSAMSLLAWLYASDPERAEFAKAAYYYRAAAEAGDQAAQNNLGELYESGKGVPQDASLAFAWYARAAEAGFPPGQLNLARMYAAGNGVAQNTVSAREWAERARRQGQDRAAELLDWLAGRP
jgi:TPR repeat protein